MSDIALTNPFEGEPHAWLQWKGTEACMDIYCACGAHMHLDAGFAYSVQCPHCKQTYDLNGHIKLHPVEADATYEATTHVLEPDYSMDMDT